MKPRMSILDPAFQYRDSANTRIELTFARERIRLAAEANAREESSALERTHLVNFERRRNVKAAT